MAVNHWEIFPKGIFFSYTSQSQEQKSDEEGLIQLRLLLQLLVASSQPLIQGSSQVGEALPSVVSIALGVFWLHFHKHLISLYQQTLLFEPHGGFLLLSLFCVSK